MSYIARKLLAPKKSFFLFGPRGTGKSYWLKNEFKPDLTIDLLRGSDFVEFANDSDLLYSKITANHKIKKIVLDEVQKLPPILDEVHRLIEQNKSLVFALTGSSARKLKRSNINLLAGRALTRSFFPFSAAELKNKFDLDTSFRFGTLPMSYLAESHNEKIDYLKSYCETYLKEEIQQEAYVRNLVSYSKFLKHLALRHGHVLNLNNISQEAGISRAPLENYLSILTDTLLGTVIEPLHLKAKVKEVSTPKFYFFDPGVVEALTGEIGSSVDSRSGCLFEGYVLNEIKSYQSNSGTIFDINYWATPNKNEVDFILSKGRYSVGIEVKYSRNWKSDHSKGLETLLEANKIKKAFLVYTGKERQLRGKIEVLPFLEFSRMLNNNEII